MKVKGNTRTPTRHVTEKDWRDMPLRLLALYFHIGISVLMVKDWPLHGAWFSLLSSGVVSVGLGILDPEKLTTGHSYVKTMMGAAMGMVGLWMVYESSTSWEPITDLWEKRGLTALHFLLAFFTLMNREWVMSYPIVRVVLATLQSLLWVLFPLEAVTILALPLELFGRPMVAVTGWMIQALILGQKDTGFYPDFFLGVWAWYLRGELWTTLALGGILFSLVLWSATHQQKKGGEEEEEEEEGEGPAEEHSSTLTPPPHVPSPPAPPPPPPPAPTSSPGMVGGGRRGLGRDPVVLAIPNLRG